MSRLRDRVQRLERGGTFADFQQSCVRLLREAGREDQLLPSEIELLCTALSVQLQALSATVPAWIVTASQVETLVERTVRTVRAVLDTQVDASQREGLYAALSQAYTREARRRGARG